LTTPPPTPTPEAPPRRSYHVTPILITLVGGILLAFGSCVGFVSTLTSNSSSKSTLFLIGFSVGVLAVIAGGIWALAAIITFFIRAASGEQ
jgi:hypothetical protein